MKNYSNMFSNFIANKEKKESTSDFIEIIKEIPKNKIVKIILITSVVVGVIFITGKILKITAKAVCELRELQSAIKK